MRIAQIITYFIQERVSRYAPPKEDNQTSKDTNSNEFTISKAYINNFPNLEFFKNQIKIFLDLESTIHPQDFPKCFFKDWEIEFGNMDFVRWHKQQLDTQVLEFITSNKRKFILKRKSKETKLDNIEGNFK